MSKALTSKTNKKKTNSTKSILYCRVRNSIKNNVTKLAKKNNISEAAVVDGLLEFAITNIANSKIN